MATDNTNLNADTHVDTRDFRIESCTLIGSDGQGVDIRAMIPELQVRQDMYMGFMSGELLVKDGIDLLAKLQIHGGEYLFLHYKVPEQAIELKKAFRIYKVGKRVPEENAQKYTLYFVSDELFNSEKNLVSKAYQDMALSDMAADILTTHLKVPTQKLFIDSTEEPDTLIIPRMRPLEALNWLASRSQTANKNTWFFYENFEGFHFKSLNTIYKAPKPIKVPFVFENKKGDKSLDMDKFAIDDMESRRDFDVVSTIASGGYAMSLTTVDPTSRTVKSHRYSAATSITKLYDNSAMSDVGGMLSDSLAHSLTYLAGHGVEKYIKRVMALAALNSNMIEIAVPGNMGVQAGTVVSCRVPYSVVPSEGDMWDKQKSGKYLCIATNHKFDMVQHKYTTLAYLCRDSLPEALPAISGTLTDKIKKLNNT